MPSPFLRQSARGRRGRFSKEDEDRLVRIKVQRHSDTPVLYVVGCGLDLAGIRVPEFGRPALDAEGRFHLLEAIVAVVHIIEISICELAMMERTQPSSGEASTHRGCSARG